MLILPKNRQSVKLKSVLLDREKFLNTDYITLRIDELKMMLLEERHNERRRIYSKKCLSI